MKNQKGITLMALIITVIIMIILAGICIYYTVGENGIIGKTINSVTSTKKSIAEEQVHLAWSSAKLAYHRDKLKVGRVSGKDYFDSNKLTNYVTEGEIIDVAYKMNEEGDSKVIFKDTSGKKTLYYTVTVKESGKVVADDNASTIRPSVVPTPSGPNLANMAEYNKADASIRNSQDMISLIQTAEGALAEVHDMLQRMNELAVKSANATNADSDRAAIGEEVKQLLEEINRISIITNFNEINLLDGTLAGNNGARLALAERNLVISIDKVDSSSLGLSAIDVSTEANSIVAIDAVQAAIDIVASVRSKLGGRQNQLEHIIAYYEAVEEILVDDLSEEEMKDAMASAGIIEISDMLQRMRELNEHVVNGTLNDSDIKAIQEEALVLKEGINIIAEDANYKGEKLLNGTYKGIPNISFADLYVGYTTEADINRTKTEVENAIKKVENVSIT